LVNETRKKLQCRNGLKINEHQKKDREAIRKKGFGADLSEDIQTLEKVSQLQLK